MRRDSFLRERQKSRNIQLLEKEEEVMREEKEAEKMRKKSEMMEVTPEPERISGQNSGPSLTLVHQSEREEAVPGILMLMMIEIKVRSRSWRSGEKMPAV